MDERFQKMRTPQGTFLTENTNHFRNGLKKTSSIPRIFNNNVCKYHAFTLKMIQEKLHVL